MLFRICILFISIFKISESFASSEKVRENFLECETPTHTGECIALKECPVLFDKFRKYNQLPESEKQIIRDSQCGYDNEATEKASKVLVCCPLDKRESSINEMLVENVEIDNSYCGVMKKGSDGEKTSSASESNFPWMALIEYVHVRDVTRIGFNCSGILVNNRYILTAAHCAYDANWKPSRIMLGDFDPNTYIDCKDKVNCSAQPLAVEIDEIIVHPNYPVDLYHDIALIRMKQHIEYTTYIRPICLPFGYMLNTSNMTNIVAEYASWGQTQLKSRAFVGRHGKFTIPLRTWNTHECRSRYRLMKREINLKYEICAGGEQDVDTCGGDSGGALMYSVDHGHMKVYYAVGVMVGGAKPCGLQGWPSISIDVQRHLQWILYQLTE